MNENSLKCGVYDITPFTALDFPGKLGAIIWFGGCNMRCSYCHNPHIVLERGTGNDETVTTFLKKRVGLLDGVVLSGGEATLYPGLVGLCRKIRDMGFAIKLDTNGLRYGVLKKLLKEGLLDYVALDYKAPRQKFKHVCGRDGFAAFSRSLNFLIGGTVAFEVRTTYHSNLLEKEDLHAIAADLKRRGYKGTYYIQQATGKRLLGNPGASQCVELSGIEDILSAVFR